MTVSSLFPPTLGRRFPLSTSAAAAASTASSFSRIARRFLHEGPDTVEELLERHVVRKSRGDDEEEELAARRRLTSTRREALGLYRDILRATRFFTWPYARGVLWRDILRENARREFEEARFESDPEVITRLLIGGRDAVQKAKAACCPLLEGLAGLDGHSSVCCYGDGRSRQVGAVILRRRTGTAPYNLPCSIS